MNQQFIDKRLSLCVAQLKKRGMPHRRTKWPTTDPVKGQEDEVVFFVELEGKMKSFDIALKSNGMTSLRRYHPRECRYETVMEQGMPDFIVDIAKDIELGYVCSHLQTR